MLKNGIYFLWFTSSPPDKDSGEQSRAHGAFCCTTVRVLYNTIQIKSEISSLQCYIVPSTIIQVLRKMSLKSLVS